MKRIILTLLFLLPIISAANPWNVNTMNATVTFSGDIDIRFDSLESEITWLEAELFLSPSDGTGQRIKLISADPEEYRIIRDDFGNQIIRLRWDDISKEKLRYTLVYEVTTQRFTSAITDPGSFNNVTALENYLEADNLSLWTGAMKNKAEFLAGNTSILEASSNIIEWIYNNIAYNHSYWSLSLPATETFPLGQGVCDEFSHLFMAFMKSLGVPSKYVQGLVFSGESWDLHAWTEVYVGGAWIPVDPTYGEVGFIDASHIVLAKVPNDNHIRNRLSWEGYATRVNFGKDLKSVKINEISDGLRLLGLRVEPSDSEAGLGQIIDINAEISNYANTYLAPSCRIAMPGEMILLDDQLKITFIPPGETSTLSWRVMTPKELKKGLVYTMPVRISCFPSVNVTKKITVLPGVSAPEIIRVDIIDATVLNSESLRSKIRNEGSKGVSKINLSACAGDCTSIEIRDLKPGEEIIRSFVELNINDSIELRIESQEFSTPGAYIISLVGIEDNPATFVPVSVKPPVLGEKLVPAGFTLKTVDSEGVTYAIIGLAVLLILFAVITSMKKHGHSH
jgi:transglutaminase-like putative cysteine protease